MKYKVKIFFNDLVVVFICDSVAAANDVKITAASKGFWCNDGTLFVLPKAITDIKVETYEDPDLHG
jgi:hypothetical protein